MRVTGASWRRTYNFRMVSPRVISSVDVSSSTPAAVATDLLIVPVRTREDLTAIEGLDVGTGGELSRAWASGELRADAGEMLITPLSEAWRARRVVAVGVGADGAGEPLRLRKALATVGRQAQARRVGDVALVASADWVTGDAAQAMVEGVLLGGYADRRFKTDAGEPEAGVPLETCSVVTADGRTEELRAAVARGVVLAGSANVARDLVNEPSNTLTPTAFAERVTGLVTEHGVTVEVLEEDELEALGMGLLLGVARGSQQPARLVVMRYEPEGVSTGPVLGLVGKGVTFDTGGISLKPPENMHRMKGDMAGGAAVVGAMLAIAQLRPAVRCLGIVPLAENMPGGAAIRPGDVLTAGSGATVEVLNTDAEGRLLLADALWYASTLGATHLVDVATLTGACVIALGKAASGLFGQPGQWVETVRASGDRVGERVWPLPLYDDYRKQLKSDTADLANVGGRPAGACTAASFLASFVGDLPWAHVDIAGTSALDEAAAHAPSGATGVMVRTLAELACATDRWDPTGAD